MPEGCEDLAANGLQDQRKVDSITHTGIIGNEQADKVAKIRTKDPWCTSTRTTLSWLYNRPHHECLDKWQKTHQLDTRPRRIPLEPTSQLPQCKAQAIARLWAQLTMMDGTPLKPALTFSCGTDIVSSKYVLLHCTYPTTENAWKVLLMELNGPYTWGQTQLFNGTEFGGDCELVKKIVKASFKYEIKFKIKGSFRVSFIDEEVRKPWVRNLN